MYPDANVRYEPPIYTYNYLLSPAKTWADFGNLDIIVNTPYYMTESGGDFSFEKTETGYQTSLDGLPEGELTFTLSEAAKPKEPMRSSDVAVRVAVVTAVLTVFYLDRKNKKRK